MLMGKILCIMHLLIWSGSVILNYLFWNLKKTYKLIIFVYYKVVIALKYSM